MATVIILVGSSVNQSSVAIASLVVAVQALIAKLLAWWFPDFGRLLFGQRKVVEAPAPETPMPEKTPKTWIALCRRWALFAIAALGFIVAAIALLSKNRGSSAEDSFQPTTTEVIFVRRVPVSTDIEDYFRKRSSAWKETYTQRVFITEWNNRPVHWQAEVVNITLGEVGQTTDMSISPVGHRDDTLGIHRLSLPNSLSEMFDVLRIGDKIIIEGRLRRVHEKMFTEITPTKIERM
jgi:hypothetical protein